MAKHSFTVATEGTRRIDHALEEVLPELGLRGRRRLCDEGHVFIGERPIKASYKVRKGKTINVELPDDFSAVNLAERIDGASSSSSGSLSSLTGSDDSASACESDDDEPSEPDEPLAVLYETEDFLVITKPAGVHSQALAGKYNKSVESLTRVLYPESELLNRLDCATSGIVLLTKKSEGQAIWKIAQNNKLAVKKYIMIVAGAVKEKQDITTRLETYKNAITKDLGEESRNSLRFTYMQPLAIIDTKDFFNPYNVSIDEPYVSLVACTIFKGLRHQIRVHMDSIGYPLLGDIRYIQKQQQVTDENFYLHHTHFSLNNFSVYSKAPWLPDMYEESVLSWIAQDEV